MINSYVNYKLLFIFSQYLSKYFNKSDHDHVQRIEY